jgi:transcriptional repressor NrdR
MRCPNCGSDDSKVLDSRPVEEGSAIRRRRECGQCAFRFSTYEEIEILDLYVVKRSGERELYSRDKLQRGVEKPFEKLGHDTSVIKKIVSRVEQEIQRKARDGIITTQEVGNLIMKEIKKVDKVAYIRFACVYREFKDVEEFKTELNKLL